MSSHEKNKDAVNEHHDYTNRFLQRITCFGIVAVTNVGDDFLVDESGLSVKWPYVHLVLFQGSWESHFICQRRHENNFFLNILKLL